MRTMQQMRPKAAPLCYVERPSSISRERESGEAGMCCRPSLLCQLAAIVYRNPFQDCLNRQLQRWLTQDLSDNSKETNGNNEIHHTAARHPTPMLHTDSDLMRRRNQTFQDSFQEMRSRATPEQTRIVFENL